ncbi:MAG TPA: hypothetical protein PK152_16350 [Anaerolineales bacterium]|nr:hypothetical protein [Anaerolineae bacterium]HRJ55923.1 hypothetical protein [Anaerolineales bacterium]HRK90708.1 hypothetical protein [Anaerolineales bacterium]
MSKYQSSVVKRTKTRNSEPHFAWRGIGCLMMIVIPIISIAAAVETINFGLENGWAIPFQLLGTPRYPDFFYRSSGLMLVLSPITAIKHFYAYAATSLIYMIFLGGIISVIYSIVYRLAGPSRENPLDVPRPNIRVKRYKR